MTFGNLKMIIGIIAMLFIAANTIKEPIEIQVTLPPTDEIIDSAMDTAAFFFERYHSSAVQTDNGQEKTDPKVIQSASLTIYRVRDAANSAASQLYAFYNLDTAITMCPSGYCVFDQNGVLYYTSSSYYLSND